MFGFLKKKDSRFEKKSYDIQYHHVCTGDSQKAHFVCLNHWEAVNALLDRERNTWIHIDWVDVGKGE